MSALNTQDKAKYRFQWISGNLLNRLQYTSEGEAH